MRQGFIVRVGDGLYFHQHIGGKLELVADTKRAWFTQDEGLAESVLEDLRVWLPGVQLSRLPYTYRDNAKRIKV